MNEPSELYLIGMTGGIACGKSAVLAMLADLGAATIDADRVTRQLQEPGNEIYRQIVAAFGEDMLTTPGGAIDRGKLGSIVFRNPAELQRLEGIVHPVVHATLQQWLREVRQGMHRPAVPAPPHHTPPEHPVAVIDAIKLLETGWKAHCNSIWVVTCSETQQIERLMSTRGMSEQEARQRINAQPPQSSRVAHADVVIDNSSTLAHTHAQVLAAWQQCCRR